MRLRLWLSAAILVLTGLDLAAEEPLSILHFAGTAVGIVLALTVLADHLYFAKPAPPEAEAARDGAAEA